MITTPTVLTCAFLLVQSVMLAVIGIRMARLSAELSSNVRRMEILLGFGAEAERPTCTCMSRENGTPSADPEGAKSISHLSSGSPT